MIQENRAEEEVACNLPSRWKRVCAVIIDLSILALIGGALGFIFPPSKFNVLCPPTILLFQLMYFYGLTYVFGATFGKMLFNLAVLPIENGSLTGKNVLLRESVRILPLLLCNILYFYTKNTVLGDLLALISFAYAVLIFSSFIFKKDSNGIYGIVSKTRVVAIDRRNYFSNIELSEKERSVVSKISSGCAILILSIFYSIGIFTSSIPLNILIGAIVAVLAGGFWSVLTLIYFKVTKSSKMK